MELAVGLGVAFVAIPTGILAAGFSDEIARAKAAGSVAHPARSAKKGGET